MADCQELFPGYEYASFAEKQEQKGIPRLRHLDRNQMILHPVEIDRLIPEDHDARAIWEITGSVDLSCYYDDVDAREGKAGAPAFDPRLLISIWIYSYSKGISSSREIARLSEYDPAYQWLCGMRPVNYHTLADFRSAHETSLRRLFIDVLALLSSEGLVTLERVMHDGTRIKASAGKDTFRTQSSLREHLALAEDQVKAMEEIPAEEVMPRVKKARERAAKERAQHLSCALRQFDEMRSPKRNTPYRVSTTDPECRIMNHSDGGLAPGYNVQISTDAKEKVIVAVNVSQSSSDQPLLASALDRIQESTASYPGKIVVDAGFTTREAILEAHTRGVDLIGSFPGSSGKMTTLVRAGISEAFYPEHFIFDPERNVYICPENNSLHPNGRTVQMGKTVFRYKGKECSRCPSKASCCPKSKRRSLTRTDDDPLVTAFREKMQTDEAKAIYRQRAEVAEFPNAWIKEKFGLRQFHLRGRVKAGMEALWTCLTYNIKIWIRLCWKLRLSVSTV